MPDEPSNTPATPANPSTSTTNPSTPANPSTTPATNPSATGGSSTSTASKGVFGNLKSTVSDVLAKASENAKANDKNAGVPYNSKLVELDKNVGEYSIFNNNTMMKINVFFSKKSEFTSKKFNSENALIISMRQGANGI